MENKDEFFLFPKLDKEIIDFFQNLDPDDITILDDWGLPMRNLDHGSTGDEVKVTDEEIEEFLKRIGL